MSTLAIRPLAAADLDAADRVLRVAFGTFLGMPDPASCFGDADFARTRFKAAPELALAAEQDRKLVGSAFVADWGSVGFFGPLTVDPTLWDKGVAKRLLDGVMGTFERLGTKQRGLFTFPGSTKHVGLYQKYGFWPQYLCAVMAKAPSTTDSHGARPFSRMSPDEQGKVLASVRSLTDSIYPGLDVTREIRSVFDQKLGDTLILGDGEGVAVCHCGPGTEAGGGAFYV
jgi:predicted N-acetyltransferase YhbS